MKTSIYDGASITEQNGATFLTASELLTKWDDLISSTTLTLDYTLVEENHIPTNIFACCSVGFPAASGGTMAAGVAT